MPVIVDQVYPFWAKITHETPPEAICHLAQVCEKGGMVGSQYFHDIYAILARGEGVDLGGEDGFFGRLQAFWAKRDIHLVWNKLNLLEEYLHGVHARHTYKTSPELAQIYMWCQEYLAWHKRVSSAPPERDDYEYLRMPEVRLGPDF